MAKVLSNEQKIQNMEGRMLEVIDRLTSKQEKDIIKSISLLKPNSKIFAKSWVLPSINLVKCFIYTVNNHKELLNNDRVKLLYEFFKHNNVCVNCDSCMNYCYNWKAYRHPDVILSRIIRMYQVLKYPEMVQAKITKQCKKEDCVRIHVDGEFYSGVEGSAYLQLWVNIANQNKHCIFYTYTKNYDLIKDSNNIIPDNFKIQLSYDDNNLHKEDIKELNLLGHKIYYTSSLDQENKPVYKNIPDFNNNEVSKCKGKCILCKQCLQDDNRIILCDLH